MSEERRTLVLENVDRVRIDYDRATDTLIIAFGEGSEEAEEAILTESDVGYRLRDGRVVEIVVFNLLRRIGLEV